LEIISIIWCNKIKRYFDKERESYMKRILLSVLFVAAFVIPVLSQTNQSKATDREKDVIAVVLGKTINIKDKDKVNGAIFGALLEQYAKENKIEPTEAELDAFVQKTEEKQKQLQAEFEKDRKKVGERVEIRFPRGTRATREDLAAANT